MGCCFAPEFKKPQKRASIQDLDLIKTIEKGNAKVILERIIFIDDYMEQEAVENQKFNIKFFEDNNFKNRKEELKQKIRIGIPNLHKRDVILKMFSINILESKLVYEEACKKVFNDVIPSEFLKVPTFTHYKSFEEAIPINFLQKEEIILAKKILWIINQQYKIEYCPLLIITLCLLLLFLSEDEAFSVIRQLIEASQKGNLSHLLRWHFTFKNIEFGRFI